MSVIKIWDGTKWTAIETIKGEKGDTGQTGATGQNGADGKDGKDGADGHSPVVTASKSGKVTTISVDGSPIATINDGEDGQDGQPGTTTYSGLSDKPSINNVTLSGNKTASDLGLGTYSKPSGGIPKTDLASGVQSSLDKADSALQSYTETDPTVPSWAKQQNKPTYTAQEVGALPSDTTIPTKVSQLQNDSGFGTYSKPSGGIPSSDMTSSVQTSLGKADSAYQKPSGGIPSTDMSSAVQTSLGKADTALQTAPVSSVNTKTGAVSLDAGDIGYDDSETYASGSVGAKLSSLSADLTDMSVEDTLLRSELPGTTQTVTFDSNNNPSTITHTASGSTVRTDVFTWSSNSVTEVRTASNKQITLTTNLTTLEQTISAISEVA